MVTPVATMEAVTYIMVTAATTRRSGNAGAIPTANARPKLRWPRTCIEAGSVAAVADAARPAPMTAARPLVNFGLEGVAVVDRRVIVGFTVEAHPLGVGWCRRGCDGPLAALPGVVMKLSSLPHVAVIRPPRCARHAGA